jgi:hypothetical protein
MLVQKQEEHWTRVYRQYVGPAAILLLMLAMAITP